MHLVEVVAKVSNQLGECPRWDSRNQVLRWLDITNQRLYQLKLDAQETLIIPLETLVSSFASRQSERFVFTTRHGFVIADEHGVITQTLMQPEKRNSARFNDSAVDAVGRLWSGTLHYDRSPTSKLYSLHADGTLHDKLHGVCVSNGIGWSPDTNIMYFVDSGTKHIYAFDYDLEQANISNKRIFVDARSNHRKAWTGRKRGSSSKLVRDKTDKLQKKR